MFYIYEYFISFIIAFVIAFAATPLAKKMAYKVGAVDIPKDERRMHKKPIPRLGGLAIVCGFMAAMAFVLSAGFFGINGAFAFDMKQMAGLLAGAAIIIAVGAVDDSKQLKAKIKLLFQLAAAIIVVCSGTAIRYVTNPFAGTGISELSVFVSYPITIMWIIGITNAINLIDGLDGLAAGVSSISSLSLFIISVISGRWDTALITAALAGATLGFLPYNFNPAKIFMGDSGSTFLGFALGVISIQGTLKSYTAIAIAIPILVLGLPLFDTIFAILRRVMKGKSIMEADRGHLHHRLVDMGLSHRQSVVVMYLVSAALGLCAVVLADRGAISAIVLVISVAVFLVAGARYMSIASADNSGEVKAKPEEDNGKEDVLMGKAKEN